MVLVVCGVGRIQRCKLFHVSHFSLASQVHRFRVVLYQIYTNFANRRDAVHFCNVTCRLYWLAVSVHRWIMFRLQRVILTCPGCGGQICWMIPTKSRCIWAHWHLYINRGGVTLENTRLCKEFTCHPPMTVNFAPYYCHAVANFAGYAVPSSLEIKKNYTAST